MPLVFTLPRTPQPRSCASERRIHAPNVPRPEGICCFELHLASTALNPSAFEHVPTTVHRASELLHLNAAASHTFAGGVLELPRAGRTSTSAWYLPVVCVVYAPLREVQERTIPSSLRARNLGVATVLLMPPRTSQPAWTLQRPSGPSTARLGHNHRSLCASSPQSNQLGTPPSPP
ncbi:hypothetical protein PsYK624_155700 [Phanerochaete sordida]|uniref:Uncharacterized protein n=1 Tax=Phanerochaete sordida TaxID=48140 RepID=A0A9P3GR44_9APHY|nr:hypothetical protein PsYK624_155700 [Phanerochaete sordida]